MGFDNFVFELSAKYGLQPYGYMTVNGEVGCGTDRDCYTSASAKSIDYRTGLHCGSDKGTGYFCAGLIYSDDWEIKDDYPWGGVALGQ